MTLAQEATTLLERQPEANIRIIIDLLHAMDHAKNSVSDSVTNKRRIGIAKDKINLPDGFDEAFDSLDSEVADLFNGERL